MAFTTATVSKVHAERFSFGGAFSEMYAVTLTVDPASIANGAKDSATFTVPGLKLGDMVLGVAAGVDQILITPNVYVSAANTLTIYLYNGSGGAIDIPTSTWRVLVGRPTWS